MKLHIPEILNNDVFLTSKINCKWNKDIASEIYTNSENEKFSIAINKISNKAMIGLTAAIAEWALWRLNESQKEKGLDLSMYFQVIESHWAGAIDKNYFYDWTYNDNNKEGVVAGALWIILRYLQRIRRWYLEGSYFITDDAAILVTLTRYLIPKSQKGKFDTWLTGCLTTLSMLYPARYDTKELDYDEYQDEFYDSTDELPVPRELFFSAEFDYKKMNLHKLINDFLSHSDYQENEFLSKPDEMIKNSFKGTPYIYTN